MGRIKKRGVNIVANSWFLALQSLWKGLWGWKQMWRFEDLPNTRCINCCSQSEISIFFGCYTWSLMYIIYSCYLVLGLCISKTKNRLAASPPLSNHCRHFDVWWTLGTSRGHHNIPLHPRDALVQQRTSDFADPPQLEYWTSALSRGFFRGTFWGSNFSNNFVHPSLAGFLQGSLAQTNGWVLWESMYWELHVTSGNVSGRYNPSATRHLNDWTLWKHK